MLDCISWIVCKTPHFLFSLTPLGSWRCPSSKTISSMGGLSRMVGLPHHGFVAAPRDSVVCLPDYEGTNKLGASFETPFGRMLVFFLPFFLKKKKLSLQNDFFLTGLG